MRRFAERRFPVAFSTCASAWSCAAESPTDKFQQAIPAPIPGNPVIIAPYVLSLAKRPALVSPVPLKHMKARQPGAGSPQARSSSPRGRYPIRLPIGMKISRTRLFQQHTGRITVPGQRPAVIFQADPQALSLRQRAHAAAHRLPDPCKPGLSFPAPHCLPKFGPSVRRAPSLPAKPGGNLFPGTDDNNCRRRAPPGRPLASSALPAPPLLHFRAAHERPPPHSIPSDRLFCQPNHFRTRFTPKGNGCQSKHFDSSAFYNFCSRPWGMAGRRSPNYKLKPPWRSRYSFQTVSNQPPRPGRDEPAQTGNRALPELCHQLLSRKARGLRLISIIRQTAIRPAPGSPSAAHQRQNHGCQRAQQR